ncbi:E3 ubiquitin-protein ligase FANCL-like [Clavelina lepadiformis]|uniref:E3 ubiquitin-protein ligase FANCL n=1 Tax=Clavelina lepadiformis TaxID=159417 RepID=A0ABP0FK62_CLALP
MVDLIPLDRCKTKYEGFVSAKGESYRIRISHLNSDGCKNARISCDWRLRHLLRNHLDLLHQRLHKCATINQFLSELQLLLENCVVDEEDGVWQPDYYDVLLRHLQDLKWDKIISISEDFQQIGVKFHDEADREHILHIELTPEYPKAAPTVKSVLPAPFQPLWPEGANLIILHDQFKTALQQYQRFWEEVDELNQKTWILEPENPNFAAFSFRIALGRSSSLQLTIDPLNCGVLPDCHFLGADWAVSEIRDRYHDKSEDWNELLSVYQNLSSILQIEFPVKDSSHPHDLSLQCGICYSYRLGTNIPDQICADQRCGQGYHHECLMEWIKSVPGAKQSFNVMFGECPYCTSPIKLNVLPT